MLDYLELVRRVAVVTLGVIVGVLVIIAISFCYSGGIWLMMSAQSPVYQRFRRRSIDRTVRRESADLDRQLVELTGRSNH